VHVQQFEEARHAARLDLFGPLEAIEEKNEYN
jgi:hypothetical protein